MLSIGTVAAAAEPAKQTAEVDLTQWPLRDIASVRDDPFGQLVKYGYRLFTDTANQIGPTVADPARRFAGNNLACGNCHLQAGSQPYAMPLVGVWGQFPQCRAREGAVDRLEDRINGCMERSMNGRALPLDSREIRAFSSYVRWLSTGIPDGAKLVGAGTLRIKEPARAADSGHGAQVFAQTCAPCHGIDGLGQRAATGAGYQFPPLWGPDSFNNGAGMSRLLTAAAYAMHNMPIGTTLNARVLIEEEAYDVAAYFVGQKRPEMANLDKDFFRGGRIRFIDPRSAESTQAVYGAQFEGAYRPTGRIADLTGVANGAFRTRVLRDYTGASDFRTRATVASFGSGAMLKQSFRHIFSIGLFSCSTSPTSSLMPDCRAASISRAISSCPTPRLCQSLRTATANSALRRSGSAE
jgi:thiosulfate dehydrogenase